jgi:hypothetical protein
VSDDNHHGLITRSYQILFVIYAPIALITILLQAFGNSSLPYLFISALIASAVSFVIAGIMWFLFIKYRSQVGEQHETGLPYLIRHQFMLLYLPVAFLSMGFCAYYIFDTYVRLALEQERLVLMLPITNALGERVEDVQQYKLALGS